MKRQKKKSVYDRIRILTVILFAAGVLAAAVYPFHSRNLTVSFTSDSGREYQVPLNRQEIAKRRCAVLQISDMPKDTVITKVWFYGASRTMRIMEKSLSGYRIFAV